MPAAPFPVIGAVAPLVTALVLWFITGSTFALLGAVIAPTMVVAHYFDGRRRARAVDRDREVRATREEAIRRESERIQRAKQVAEQNRERPSIADIARSPEWVPARSGDMVVRLGHSPDGKPWCHSIEGGVAVVGSGEAAEAVWLSALINARAQLGEPSGNASDCTWPGGARLVRGEAVDVATTIRCAGNRISSLALRGGLPHSGEWLPDDASLAPSVLQRMAHTLGQLRFADRSRCETGIGLAGTTPLVFDLASDTPHVLIAGRTGSGKSLALSALVLDWAERFAPDELTVLGIDFKGGATLRRFERIPHVAALVTDLDDDVVPRMLAGLVAETRRREAEFSAQRVTRIEEAHGIPRLAIVIDEAHEFLRSHPAAHDVLADIARRGRSLGVHLVVAVQQISVMRDSLLANIPVRIALAANTPFDVAQVVGRPVSAIPERGRSLVSLGDGVVREVELRVVQDADVEAVPAGTRASPPWRQPLISPLERSGRTGFGMLDDTERGTQRPAVWTPTDGDVLIVGDRGSGKSTALRHFVDGLDVTWVRTMADLDGFSDGVIVVDDVDRMLADLSPAETLEALERLSRARAATPRNAILYSAAAPVPRITGPIANVLTLRLGTPDEHRATGASASTWSRNALPGMGVWDGVRVVVYASTDSMVTESIP